MKEKVLIVPEENIKRFQKSVRYKKSADKEELEDKKLKLDVANGWVSLFKFAWWVLAAITGAVVDSLAGNPIGNLIRRLIE